MLISLPVHGVFILGHIANLQMIMSFTFSRVLGVTSLWMLLPCLVILQRTSLTFAQMLFCIHLCVLCMASVGFWYHPLKGTTWHQLDRCCAATFIFNAGFYLICTHHSIGTVVLWLTLTLCAAWGSHILWLRGCPLEHLLMHLVFRYIAYWGAHAILINSTILPYETKLITQMYLLHASLCLLWTMFCEYVFLLSSNLKAKRASYVLHCLLCMQSINSTSKVFLN